MAKFLYIGDPHVTVDELPDCQNLLGLIEQTATAHEVDAIVFLGDQYHSHAIVHLDVMEFWHRAFDILTKDCEVICLVGNHDRPGGEESTAHAMLAHRNVYAVADQPLYKYGINFVPWCRTEKEFLEKAERNPGGTLVCHQTFQGAYFENGFYAPEGFNSNLIKKAVISGHIHSPQSFGNVWYPGAPRWRTLSDANTDRAIWVVEHDKDGNIISKTPIDTGNHCRQIRHAADTPENQVSLPLDPKHDWRIDIEGPADYISQRKSALSGPGVRIRTFETQSQAPKVKESEGIGKAFESYIDNFVPRNGTDPGILRVMVSERIGNV